MDILIYFGIFIVIIGIAICGLAIWAIGTHREKKYNQILQEHMQQSERVKNKLMKEGDKANEN